MANKKEKRTSNPRLRFTKGYQVNVSGVAYEDMRAILTAAALYNYDERKKKVAQLDEAGVTDEQQRTEALSFFDHRRWIIDTLRGHITSEIDRDWKEHYPQPEKTLKDKLKERAAEAVERRKTREILDKILAGME